MTPTRSLPLFENCGALFRIEWSEIAADDGEIVELSEHPALLRQPRALGHSCAPGMNRHCPSVFLRQKMGF